MLKVMRARKVINFLKIYFILLVIFEDIFVFRYGVTTGILRAIIRCIPLIAILTTLDSIYSGNKKDVQRLSLLLGFGVLIETYSIINSEQDIILTIIVALLTLSYIIQILYLNLSKDMKKLYKYYDKRNSLNWIWNWSGKCMGYAHDGHMWSEQGRLIGKFSESEIYSFEGFYIGEVCSNGRIGIKKSKKGKSIEPFESNSKVETFEKLDNISNLVVYTDIEDFAY